MAIRDKCLYCGEPVSQNGYCTGCKMNQEFLRKAFNTSNYHYNIALDRVKMRDLSGALDSLKMSLRYNKMNISSRNLMGLVLYQMGEVVPAASHWVISLNYQTEQNPAAHYLKELKGDPKELERMSTVAREFNQALEHAKQHSFDLARIALRKALSMNRNFVKGHLLMALIYEEQGRRGMAKKCLTRVLSIDRTNVTAERYLREMGESEDKIARLVEQSADDADDIFDDYYGMEATEGQRPARKIEPVTTPGKRRSVTVMKRFKESNLARYSNVYMFAGIVIGVLLFYFLLIPGIRKTLEADKDIQETSYLKELSARNSEISGMQLEISESKKAVDKVNQEKAVLEKKIESLNAQMDALKNQLSSGGVMKLPDGSEKQEGEEGDSGSEDGQDENDSDEQDVADPDDEGGDEETGDEETGDGEDGDEDTGDGEDTEARASRNPVSANGTKIKGITVGEIEAIIADE